VTYAPIKVKNIASGVILGGSIERPYKVESISKAEPNRKQPPVFRPAEGYRVELLANNTTQLKEFIVENTYENLFGLLGNRVAFTDFTAEFFDLSGHWVISASMWDIPPEYVRSARVQYATSRTITGFQQDTVEITSPNAPEAPATTTVGNYVLVGRMGDQGVGTGPHYHFDEFPDASRIFRRQIPPTRLPGRPASTLFRVGKSKTYSQETTFMFGQQPGFVVTSGYGMRKGKPHRGVDCVSDKTGYNFIFCPAGQFKKQTGVTGYGTYVWCGNHGIGHMDLLGSDSVASTGSLGGIPFSPLSLGLDSLGAIARPSDRDGYAA
jgi:hypothetical protein